MPPTSCILSEPYAGLQAQALGLAEAAGLAPSIMALHPRFPWRLFPAASWPAPLRAVGLSDSPAELLFSAGGTAGAVAAALRLRGARVVQVQNPRLSLEKFDLVVANRHDGLSGPNVIVTRTALHRATPARLAEAAAIWAPRLAHLPRPLVAVLVGGSNGRFRFERSGRRAPWPGNWRSMMARKTNQESGAHPVSRRTSPAVRAALA